MNETAPRNIHVLSQLLAARRERVWKSDLPPPGHASLISYLRKTTDTQLLTESKLERVRFSVAFSLTLRKPRGEQTTVRLLHQAMPMKEKIIMSTLAIYKSISNHCQCSSCYRTAYESYIGIGMVHIIFKSRILSHGLEVQNGQEVVKILLRNLIFVLH